MKKNFVESLVGVAIVILALSFFIFARGRAEISTDVANSYNLIARFDKVDGINIGSDVKIAGIKVGSVTSEKLDYSSFEAVLGLSISSDVKLPSDSIASIVSSGLLGGKYVNIDPGAEDSYLEDDGKIIYTQSSVNLETLIGKFMFKDGD